MKKIVVFLVAAFVFGLIATSCKTQGPPCPAYADKAQTERNAS